MGHPGVIRGHQRTRADARIAGRAPLVSTCASIAHQLVCRPVCSPDESESHMRAYLMRRAIRRPQSEEGGNQTSSEVISVRASEALPMQSGVIRCHQRSSAYERPRPSRWGTLRAEKRWITCAGSGRRGDRLQWVISV